MIEALLKAAARGVRVVVLVLNEELNLTVYDAGLARRLEVAFEEDLSYASKISYEEWNSRGIGERIFEWFSFPVRDYL
jgi:phosphatidylserine/phosphatidylglycerophosphate/cardiolipin synthase-like enzyme